MEKKPIDGVPFYDRRPESLRGIGSVRAAAFAKAGLTDFRKILNHFPRAYQNRGHICSIAEGPIGGYAAYLLTVGSNPRTVVLPNRKLITKFSCFDESGTVTLIYFNSRYIEGVYHVGETYRFWGKQTILHGSRMLTSPISELWREGRPLPDFVPIYPVPAGLTQKIIADAVTAALSCMAVQGGDTDVLPRELRERLMLPDVNAAYRMIHQPASFDEIERARSYFTMRQAYLFSLALVMTKDRCRDAVPCPMKKDVCDFSLLMRQFPFPLTGAQKRSIDEITADMTAGTVPMSRLLSGDVGSGKTAVASAAIFVALQNGCQAAMMAPTEILAAQHANDLSALFSSLGYRVALLLGSMTASKKRSIRESVAAGEIDLVIGTHALLTEETCFCRLGLVITDEQHRFGVIQRASLGRDHTDKCQPHVLVMSATPIPRTLSLVLYGELSLSILDEMPPGRQTVETYVIDEGYRARLYRFIRRQISEGRQVYVVTPAVEEPEEEGDILSFGTDGKPESAEERTGIKAAVSEYRDFCAGAFSDCRVGLLHGRMKGDEKAAVMNDFAAGNIDILVSTTVIEVGVNVPNASLMVIENAERFGLAQLHQLRGRVGRGSARSYCVLLSSSKSKAAAERLNVMKTNHNGFQIAEYDLKARGPGDYFPTEDHARQHGCFSVLEGLSMDHLKIAMETAERVLHSDPLFSRPENRLAAQLVRQQFLSDKRLMQ